MSEAFRNRDHPNVVFLRVKRSAPQDSFIAAFLALR